MPAICEQILQSTQSKLSENLTQSFKKQEKENFESQITPTAKQILSSKIEYEALTSYTNPFLTSSNGSAKVIALKPNQPPLSNGKATSSGQNGKYSAAKNQLPQPKVILFARENVKVGWNSLGRNWSAGCGFNNIGNTCYLNSTLQAFFHVPALAHWLLSDLREHGKSCNSNGGYQPCIICAMANTLNNSQRPSQSMTPSYITNRLQSICKHLQLGRQEDAHEFLRYLVENMEKSFLNRSRNMAGFKELDTYSKETTPLNQILGGYLRSTVTCLSCSHESVTFQHFLDLPVDISRVNTLNDAISGYFAREKLDECDYKCESCKKKVSATKRFSLERAPVVLCIQLKRFNQHMSKIGKPIQITINLDLPKQIRSGDPNQNYSYRLVSMVTHLGSSANGGHYTAIGLAPNNQYYCFDDSHVSATSVDGVLKTNAYLLFFELTSRPHHQPITSFSHTEHTYSKSAEFSPSNLYSSTSSSSSASSTTSFAKPKLPMLPASILHRQNQQKQKENETTPVKLASSPNGANGKATNGSAVKVASKLFSPTTNNGIHHHDSSEEEDEDESEEKRRKSVGPSVPRLLSTSDKNLTLTPSTSSQSTASPCSPSKPRSLVPYDVPTDDEEDEVAGNGSQKNDAADRINLLRTSSGVFIESEVNQNSPSKEGSTTDRIIVTKSPSTNGTPKQSNGGGGNGYVKRSDDTLTQLTKLNHSGYGTSEVSSWDNKPSNMVREVDNDQREDRKRHLEEDDDEEMDMGKAKKVKYGINYSKLQNSSNNQGGKLPNPFQEHQNNVNQNGNGDRYRQNYNGNGNGFNNRYNNGNLKKNVNGKFNKNHGGYNNAGGGGHFYNNKTNYPNKNHYNGNRKFSFANNRR